MRIGIIGGVRRKFAAQYFADLSKAVFAVALASKFFIDMTHSLRILMPAVGLLFIVAAFLIHPKGETQ